MLMSLDADRLLTRIVKQLRKDAAVATDNFDYSLSMLIRGAVKDLIPLHLAVRREVLFFEKEIVIPDVYNW